MIATRTSARSIPPTSVVKIPAASKPRSLSCGRKTSCPPLRIAATSSAFQARSAAEKSGPAKYTFIAALPPSGFDESVLDVHRLEVGAFQKLSPLLLVALPSGEENEHQQIQPLTAVRLVSGRDDGVHDDQSGVLRSRCADRAEDRAGALVVPVVEDRRQDVRVGGRHMLEEVAGDECATVAECLLV